MKEYQVIAECDGTEMSTEEIEVLDIREGMEGEDVVKYRCPRCGEEEESRIYMIR